MNCGCVVENALFSIGFNFQIGAILVNGQTVSLSYHNQIAVLCLHIPATEQDAAIGDTMLMIAMALRDNAEAVVYVDALKALDTDGIFISNRELMSSVRVDFGQQYGSPP